MLRAPGAPTVTAMPARPSDRTTANVDRLSPSVAKAVRAVELMREVDITGVIRCSPSGTLRAITATNELPVARKAEWPMAKSAENLVRSVQRLRKRLQVDAQR